MSSETEKSQMELEIKSLKNKLETVHNLCNVDVPKVHKLDNSTVFLSTGTDVFNPKKTTKSLGLYNGIYIIPPLYNPKLEKVEDCVCSREGERTVISIKRCGVNILEFVFDYVTRNYVKMYCRKNYDSFSTSKFVITREHMNDLLDSIKEYF